LCPLRLAPIAAGICFATTGLAQAAAPVVASGVAASGVSGAGVTATPATAQGTQLPAVVISGQRENETGTGPVNGIVAKRSTAGTKTDTPIIRTPQAISVVTADQISLQGAQSVAQALRYTSGVFSEQRGTNTDALEYLYARGFLIDQFWNGLRTPGAAGGFGYNVTSYDPYLLERVEFLHGPASVIYGQGSPGGTVNLVSKLPTAEPFHEIGVQTGSDGRVQGFFDFSGPVDKDGKLLYRVTADGFNTGTQTDFVNQQRFSIAPSVTWRPTKDTSLTVYAQYQADPEAGYYNSIPAVGTVLGGPVSIPRHFNPGDPTFDSLRKTQEAVGYMLSHRLNDTWSFRQSYRFLYNSASIKYLQSNGYAADGTSLARIPYLNEGMVNSHTVDNQANAKFVTGPLKHNLLLGVDYQNLHYNHDFFQGASAPTISIVNPVYGQPIPYPTNMLASSGAESVKQLGAYAQDQIDIGRWSFLLGMREDWANTDFASYKTGGPVYHESNRAFTWRAGGVYQFDSGIAPYVSYSKSFQPQVGASFGGQTFVPTTGEQYEIGVKFQPKGYNSFVTVSAFHLDQNNVTTTDPVHAGFSVQTGQVRSQGFEVEGHADFDNGLELIGTYTYTNLLNTKSNTTSLDKVPTGIPRNAASLWADYTMHGGPFAGLRFGGGVRYIGGSYGDTTNTFSTSSATLVDLAVRYDLGKSIPSMVGWEASLNATNLLDRHYIASCSGDTFCTWGSGRLILAGMRYQW